MSSLEQSPKRSAELLKREEKFRAFRMKQEVRSREPKQSGRSVQEFVELSTTLAETYQPSGYLKRAPSK